MVDSLNYILHLKFWINFYFYKRIELWRFLYSGWKYCYLSNAKRKRYRFTLNLFISFHYFQPLTRCDRRTQRGILEAEGTELFFTYSLFYATMTLSSNSSHGQQSTNGYAFGYRHLNDRERRSACVGILFEFQIIFN